MQRPLNLIWHGQGHRQDLQTGEETPEKMHVGWIERLESDDRVNEPGKVVYTDLKDVSTFHTL